nr:hypothetical protein [uncultured Gellertiella sp.]
MSELRLSFPASAIAGKGKLTADDIHLLRTETFPEGVQDTEGAVLLLALHNSCRETCPQWAPFFIDSLTQFIVHHTFPQGSLDDANALWLERMLSTDGVIASELELKLLLHVMTVAAHVPESLKVFALSQLRHAVHGDSGAYARRRRGHQRALGAADLEFARFVVGCGAPGDAPSPSGAIHRVLLSIDAISNPALNESGWVRFLYLTRTGERSPQARTPMPSAAAARSNAVAAA